MRAQLTKEAIDMPLSKMNCRGPNNQQDVLAELSEGAWGTLPSQLGHLRTAGTHSITEGCHMMWSDPPRFVSCIVSASHDSIVSDAAVEAGQLAASIVESSDDAIICASLDGRIWSWNPGAERMFGYGSAEIVTQSLRSLMAHEHKNEVEAALARIRAGDRVKPYETLGHCKDGGEIPISVACCPLHNALGQVTALCEIARDISHRDRIEKTERTHEKLAAMGQLASRIAHDINNPLMSVTNLLYLIQKEKLTAEGSEYVHVAQRELGRIARISAQSLGIYRVDGEAQLQSPACIADEVLSLYRDRMITQQVNLEREYNLAPLVSCHADDLHLVIFNIVGNALDAMPGGGKLRVRIRGSFDFARKARGVNITVGDTGRGMSADTRSRLFEPFFTTKKATGTGLGLWRCAHIVTRYGGNILVRSSDLKGRSGSVFTIFLPL